jgi:hypothetical protein
MFRVELMRQQIHPRSNRRAQSAGRCLPRQQRAARRAPGHRTDQTRTLRSVNPVDAIERREDTPLDPRIAGSGADQRYEAAPVVVAYVADAPPQAPDAYDIAWPQNRIGWRNLHRTTNRSRADPDAANGRRCESGCD